MDGVYTDRRSRRRMSEETVKQRIERYRERVKELDFYDCSLWLGKPGDFPLARTADTALLSSVVKAHGLCGGLVSHWETVTLSAQDGNRTLLEALPKLPDTCRIVWAGLPLFPPDSGPLPGVDIPPGRLTGVRLFPRTHGYNLQDWVIGPLLDWLAQRRLPLFLWHTEVDWAELHVLAKKYPHLPFVVETQREKVLYHARVLFSLMKVCENVYIDSSNLMGAGYTEYVVREFSAGRLLFGSFFPVNDPAVSMGMVIDADIGEEDRRLIASGNILHLLEGVKS
jgi:hypothetical protein